MAKTEKRYNKKFKDGVVRLVLDNGRSVASVAKDLGISEQTVYRWLDQQKIRQRPNKIRIIELEAALKAANRRVVDLEETVTILKKATAIFATPPQK